MRAIQLWKAVTIDKANLLEGVIGLLREKGIRYCVIGGVAVNAYAEPVITLDLDLAVAVDQLEQTEALLARSFNLERFPHSLNVTAPDSELRVQIQTDKRFSAFPTRAASREILGMNLPVAAIEDVLDSKIWAAQDRSRRPSKHIKDLSDIARLLETHPELRARVPEDIFSQLREHGV